MSLESSILCKMIQNLQVSFDLFQIFKLQCFYNLSRVLTIAIKYSQYSHVIVKSLNFTALAQASLRAGSHTLHRNTRLSGIAQLSRLGMLLGCFPGVRKGISNGHPPDQTLRLAQLIEHYTGISEVMGSTPVQA